MPWPTSARGSANDAVPSVLTDRDQVGRRHRRAPSAGRSGRRSRPVRAAKGSPRRPGRPRIPIRATAVASVGTATRYPRKRRRVTPSYPAASCSGIGCSPRCSHAELHARRLHVRRRHTPSAPRSIRRTPRRRGLPSTRLRSGYRSLSGRRRRRAGRRSRRACSPAPSSTSDARSPCRGAARRAAGSSSSNCTGAATNRSRGCTGSAIA